MSEQRQPVKCLIVDDLDGNLLALAALLRSDEVEVLQARSGREALELLLVHEVALALIDVQMPEMDGFQLAELMRGSARTRAVPIIFVTAGTHDQQRLFQGYDSGAVDFLFKPIEPHVLRSKADVFFRLHRQSAELARTLQERTQTLKLNEMFTAVLGHDLRGPLSALLMSAQILSRRTDDSTRKAGERMLVAGRWMGRMIDDMLDLTRTRIGGGLVVRRASLDLGELAERVVQERQAVFPDRRIVLARQGDTTCEADADRLNQLLSNLVGNALVHGDAAEPVEVVVDGREATSVVVSVANGGTIPADLLPVIFDPFRSGRQTTNRSEGLGLGLYIVQHVVRAHGGEVVVESPQSGSTTLFRVTLPRR